MESTIINLGLLALKDSIKKKTIGGKLFLRDKLRAKYVKADPEEWVRQLLILYLIEKKDYPQGRISLERTIIINEKNKRFDALVYDEYLKPLLIIECKSPHVGLTKDTLNQIMTYNISINAPYIILSNGIDTVMGKVNFQEKSYLWFSKILNYKDLI